MEPTEAIQQHLGRTGGTVTAAVLAGAVQRAVRAGGLSAGDRLPTVRSLARVLQISPDTVARAYRELGRRGVLAAAPGRGTFIADGAGVAAEDAQPCQLRAASRVSASLAMVRLAQESGGAIPMSAAIADPTLAPLELVRRAANAVFRQRPDLVTNGPPAEGLPALRAAVAAHLTSLGGRQVNADEVLVTTGAQQGIDLSAAVLGRPGDAVLVEEFTYVGALESFRQRGLRAVPVPMDDQGIDPDALEHLVQFERPRFAYLQPTFQSPTGLVLSSARRQRALDVLGRWHVPLVEDTIFCDVDFRARPSLPLGLADSSGSVIMVGSFSKTMYYGIRLGYLVTPSGLAERFAIAKYASDGHTSPLVQAVMELLIRVGRWQEQAMKVRQVYRQRRDALDATLSERAGELLQWRRPEGGFNFWLRLPAGVSDQEVVRRALAHGLAISGGSAFQVADGPCDWIRLSFSTVPIERVGDAVKRLVRTVEEAAAQEARLGRAPSPAPA